MLILSFLIEVVYIINNCSIIIMNLELLLMNVAYFLKHFRSQKMSIIIDSKDRPLILYF